MKKILFIAAVGLLLAGCNGQDKKSGVKASDMPKAAQKAGGGGGIAYIETDTIMNQYEFCLDKQKELENKQAALQQKLQGEASAIERAMQSLQNDVQSGKITNEQQYNQRQQNIATQQQTYQKHEAEYTQEMADATIALNKELRQRINDFIKEYNKDGRFAIILTNSQADLNVIYAEPSMDITADVLEGLNKAYKKDQDKAEKAQKAEEKK